MARAGRQRLGDARLMRAACAAGLLPVLACSAGGDPGKSDRAGAGSGGGASSPASAGSGGDASGTGSGSGGGATGSGATGGGATGCARLPLCDDFEGAELGGPPDPSRWTVASPSCSGTGTLAIGGGAHSGDKCLVVSGKGGYCDHVFIANESAVAAIGDVLFARFWVRLAAPLGAGHVTFATMRDDADGPKDLRLGGQSMVLVWNRESDDATLPSLSPAGIAKSAALAADTWQCVELMVDGPQGLLRTWVDGAEIEGLQVDEVPTADVDQAWLSRAWSPVLSDFKLGWESYGGQEMALSFDDVALAATRIGCD